MEPTQHKFETLEDFRGRSLDYFTTHAELVRAQSARKAKQTQRARAVTADGDWNSDTFVEQSATLTG